MTEAEVIDRINSTIKKNGKNAITGEEMNFVLKAIIQLIADAGGTVNWGDIEGTIADQLDLASALNNKVDVVSGKGLSTNDFTNTLKSKLDVIEAGAEVNVKADWNATSGDAEILNKPNYFNPRVQSVTSSATVTAISTNDLVTITAQDVGLTLENPTGAFVEGQSLIFRIKDDGTAQTITYDSDFRAIGVVAPTTTVASKTTYIGCIYNSTDSKFDIVGVCTEA